MRNSLKILHTADLHLGTPYRYLDFAKQKTMRSEQEKIFFKIITMCTAEKVDFLVIAGDLFDSPEPEQDLLDRVYQGFASIPQIKIIINPGNHDYWHQFGLWQKFSDLDNIFIFEPGRSYCEFEEHKLRFHGKPFISQSAPTSLWLNSEPELNSDFTNILIQHGDLSVHSSQSNYNPIELHWLDRIGFDFALLGHVHNIESIIFTDGGIPCLYSGCPVGRGFDEPGIKGVYLIDLADQDADFSEKIKFIPLSGAQFHNFELDINSLQADSQIELQNKIIHSVQVKTKSTNQNSKFDCLKLTLIGMTEQKVNSEMLLNKLTSMFFHAELVDRTTLKIDFSTLLVEHSLRGDVTRYAKQLATRADLLNNMLEEIGLSDINAFQAKQMVENAYQLTMQAAEQDLDVYED